MGVDGLAPYLETGLDVPVLCCTLVRFEGGHQVEPLVAQGVEGVYGAGFTSKNGARALAVLTGDIEPAADRERAPRSEIVTLSDLPWIDARPGVRQKRIWEDKAADRRALLARFEPGATLPPHRHVGDELIFLVEGANADESGVVATGNVNYRPNGCVHAVTTQNGATVFAVVWGRTEPV